MDRIDLNADLGESFGAYTLGLDEEVLRHVSSANVACGLHAGDPTVMDRTVRLAAGAGVAVGAHPGYPDLAGFGRRDMALTPAEAKACVLYQVGALSAFARAAGVPLCHVKLHGALYNRAAKDFPLALAVCEGIREADPELIFLGLSGSEHGRAAKEAGLRFGSEVFADRGYQDDGTLVPRGQPGAMIRDREAAADRAIRMAREGLVQSVSGRTIPIRADSICVHGDNPDAVGFVRLLRERLEAEGIQIVPLRSVLG